MIPKFSLIATGYILILHLTRFLYILYILLYFLYIYFLYIYIISITRKKQQTDLKNIADTRERKVEWLIVDALFSSWRKDFFSASIFLLISVLLSSWIQFIFTLRICNYFSPVSALFVLTINSSYTMSPSTRMLPSSGSKLITCFVVTISRNLYLIIWVHFFRSPWRFLYLPLWMPVFVFFCNFFVQ